VRKDRSDHWPEHYPTRLHCQYCKKGTSRWRCSKCLVSLCLNDNNNCFYAYHCDR
jgi:hypothetical protein